MGFVAPISAQNNRTGGESYHDPLSWKIDEKGNALRRLLSQITKKKEKRAGATRRKARRPNFLPAIARGAEAQQCASESEKKCVTQT